MAGLDYLFNGTPASLTQATTSTTNLPDWYQEYQRAMAGKATEVAGQGYQAYPGEQVAGFNGDQQNAFQQVRDNQGSWQPGMGAALGSASGIADAAGTGTAQAGQYAQGAVNATAGPAASWTNNWQQYMSPYTQSVVDEIGRQGNLNLQQNVLPGINSTFTGSGQFGSGRNAAILGQGVAQAQGNISGQQANALEAGYGQAASIFGQDANRQQQQEQMQANTGLGAAGVANNSATINSGALDSQAQRLGALTQLQQSMQNQDTAALGAVGGQEQALQQAGDTAGLNNFNEQKNYDWTNLANMNSILRGMPLSGSTAQAGQTTQSGAGVSPLGWLTSLYGTSQAGNGP